MTHPGRAASATPLLRYQRRVEVPHRLGRARVDAFERPSHRVRNGLRRRLASLTTLERADLERPRATPIEHYRAPTPTPEESTLRPPEPTFRSGLYDGTAADYDRFRLPYADGLVDLVRAELALDGTGLLVDLGAGTGQVARALRPFFERVVAVDPEPGMVEYGRTRTEREADGIEWHLARAEDVEFPSGSVDVVASGNAFHRFDRPVVVANATRWLSADGVIVVLGSDGVLGRDEPWQLELSRVVDKWLEQSGAAARIPVGWERNEYTDEIVLRDAGFDRQVVHSVTVRQVWSVETIVGFLRATSFASRAALQEHVDAFDADVRDVLLSVDPSGIFSQDVTFGARLARR